MEIKVLFTVFITVFLAELGDKTQLATLLFATEKGASKLLIFSGASLALITTSAIGVFAGQLLANIINPAYLQKFAGAGFVIIGILMFFKT
ncbi:MAG: TMEM165/GDT1 family protein [Spirochaetia bacterium]|nr:TMEM165/GDT1 family protein [Spirochaetia bacterium]